MNTIDTASSKPTYAIFPQASRCSDAMATIAAHWRDTTITVPINAAATMKLHDVANRYNSDVLITCNGKSASAKCLLMLQTLRMDPGTTTRVVALGADAQAAVERLIEMLGRPI